MLCITNHQGNANLKTEITPQTKQIGTRHIDQPLLVWVRVEGREDPPSLLVGMSTGLAFLEDNTDTPHKTRNCAPRHFHYGSIP